MRGRVAILVVAAAFGFVVAGVLGAGIGAVAGWMAPDERRSTRAWTAGLAVALLGFAALATAFEGSRDVNRLGSDFAAEREAAGLAARSAAIVTFAFLATGVATHRHRLVPTRPRAAANEPWRASSWLPATVAAVGSSAMRIGLGPEPLSPLYRDIADHIERGVEFGRGGGFDAASTAVVMPAAPIIGGLSPFGPRPALVVAGAALAAMMVVIGGRRSPTAAWAVAVLAVVAPMLWSQQLPATLAALGSVAAWSSLDDRAVRLRPVLAGVWAAFAVLARPEALLLFPVLVVWLLLRRQARAAAVVLVVGALCLAPWQLWVHRNFDTWWPTTAAGPVLAAATDGDDDPLGALGSFELPEAAEEAAAHGDGVDAWFDRLIVGSPPHVLGARALRAWDVWGPSDSADRRADRGLPYPGGAPGAVANAVILGMAIGVGARGWRQWRQGWPMLAMPVAATLGVMATFGDRALVGWAAPAVVLAAALAIVRLTKRAEAGSSAVQPSATAENSA